ncbi:hypothetical protein ADL21_06275 [Streptomyces albus subsp. albus]|nr:hypothetical protein ADL21_06275 [Streptomyces albus subsp. albus]
MTGTVHDIFGGFWPPLSPRPPRPEGRTIDCPHCGCRCADPYGPDFTSEWGCEGLLGPNLQLVQED